MVTTCTTINNFCFWRGSFIVFWTTSNASNYVSWIIKFKFVWCLCASLNIFLKLFYVTLYSDKHLCTNTETQEAVLANHPTPPSCLEKNTQLPITDNQEHYYTIHHCYLDVLRYCLCNNKQ